MWNSGDETDNRYSKREGCFLVQGKTKYKRLPVIRAGKAVFNCQKETSVELIRLIEVANKVKTLDQELCKEMIEKVSRKV